LKERTTIQFFSKKCRKNSELGRKSHDIGWVKKMKHTRAEKIAEIKEQSPEKAEEKKEEKKTEKK